jgi:hypothetical protein
MSQGISEAKTEIKGKELQGRRRGGIEAIINIGYRRGSNVKDERGMESNTVSSDIDK